MKPSDTEITASEDNEKIRKSLHELQPSATDKETLVGADRMKSNQKSKETKPKKDTKTKKGTSTRKKMITKDKAIQTGLQLEKVKIEPEDLTSTDIAGTSTNYWQILAERRRIALKDALEENKEMAERLEKLEEEKRTYKEMLNETRALVEVLQEMIEDDRNDINNSLEDSVL